MTRYARAYRRIARQLSRVDLVRRSMSLEITADDVDPARQREDRRFLDYYGDEGLTEALGKYGLLAAVEAQGYRDLGIHTRADDERHTMTLTGICDDLPEPQTLVELVVRRDRLVVRPPVGMPALDDPELEALTVDWLELRSPRARFTRQRPRLPGQAARGLGIAERVLELLYRVVERLGLSTLATVAAHFHNAHFYEPELPFLDPLYTGELRALRTLLLDDHALSVPEASWAIEWGAVKRPDGAPFVWRGQLMVWPHAQSLREYLAHPAYEREAKEAAIDRGLTLDRAAFDARWTREAPALRGETLTNP